MGPTVKRFLETRTSPQNLMLTGLAALGALALAENASGRQPARRPLRSARQRQDGRGMTFRNFWVGSTPWPSFAN